MYKLNQIWENECEFKNSLFHIFQINLEDLFKIEFIFLKHLNFSPKHFNDIEYYEMQILMKEYKEWIEEENKRREKEEKNQTMTLDQNKYMKEMKSMQPKMPTMNIPKFK